MRWSRRPFTRRTGQRGSTETAKCPVSTALNRNVLADNISAGSGRRLLAGLGDVGCILASRHTALAVLIFRTGSAALRLVGVLVVVDPFTPRHGVSAFPRRRGAQLVQQ